MNTPHASPLHRGTDGLLDVEPVAPTLPFSQDGDFYDGNETTPTAVRSDWGSFTPRSGMEEHEPPQGFLPKRRRLRTKQTCHSYDEPTASTPFEVRTVPVSKTHRVLMELSSPAMPLLRAQLRCDETFPSEDLVSKWTASR
jgi:hypothetical protein